MPNVLLQLSLQPRNPLILLEARVDSDWGEVALHLKVAQSPAAKEGPIAKWVCLEMVSTPKPNGFADHYPYEMAISLGIYPTFSDKPKLNQVC